MDVDGSCQFSADSQPKSIGLVWWLVATRHSVYIHYKNRVDSHNDCGHGDSTTNIIVVIITNIIIVDATHARLTALCPGLPRWAGNRKENQSGFYWSKRQWVAVASARPYANLHIAPDK